MKNFTEHALFKRVTRGKRTSYEYYGEDRLVMPYHPGSYLVVVDGGITSYQRLDPDLPAHSVSLEAALSLYQDGVCRALAEAAKATPPHRPLTPKEKRAYAAFEAVMGKDAICTHTVSSYSEIAWAGAMRLRQYIEKANNG